MLTNKNNTLSEQNRSQVINKNTNLFSKSQNPCILIAENDKKHRGELKSIIELYGIKILEAKNGEEAVHLTVCESPDLVLINSDLPKLNGFEAIRLLRNIRQFDEMPVIVYSENTERVVRKKAFELGADSFHIAPLDFERIDYILENFLFRGKNKNYLHSIFKEL